MNSAHRLFGYLRGKSPEGPGPSNDSGGRRQQQGNDSGRAPNGRFHGAQQRHVPSQPMPFRQLRPLPRKTLLQPYAFASANLRYVASS